MALFIWIAILAALTSHVREYHALVQVVAAGAFCIMLATAEATIGRFAVYPDTVWLPYTGHSGFP